MQYSDNKQYTVPLVKSTQWDEHTLENIIISFTMLEDIANTIFNEVESKIDKSLAEIDNIKNRVDKAQLSIKKLENAGTKTTFYSTPNFPSFSSSNIHFSLQSSNDDEDAIISKIHNTCSLTNTPNSSHTTSDPASALNAFESLFATPEPVIIHDSSILNPSQIGVFSNLICSIDPLTSYYESIPDSTYEPGEYFYSKEEDKEVIESPVSPEPCTISDDDEEDEDEIRLTGSIYKERRETRRATSRISLMINDGVKDPHSRLSILHKPAARPPPLPNSAVPSSKPPPVVPSLKQLPTNQQVSPARRTLGHSSPPPPPTKTIPSNRLSHSTPSQPISSTPPPPPTKTIPSNRLTSSTPPPPPSQPVPSTPPPPPTQSIPPTRPMNNLMSSLCAEIRASGGKVSKTNSTPSPVSPSPSPSPSQPTSQSRPPTPMSAGLLAEIQGADVKSILRQKREQLSASLKQEAKEETSPRIPDPQQEPQPQLDMLQRRKLGYE